MYNLYATNKVEEEEETFPAPTENACFLPFVVRYLKLAGQVRFGIGARRIWGSSGLLIVRRPLVQWLLHAR